MEIIDGTPLLVAATPEEISHAPKHVPLILTGIGTVATAITLTSALAKAAADGRVPSRIINFGTAGALTEVRSGIFEISSVYQHDLSSDLLEEITGKAFPNRIDLEVTGSFPTARLATGDSFIADSATRELLAQQADLADMEGYAVARVAAHFDLPVTLIKQLSDAADEHAPGEWTAAATGGAMDLGEALDRVLS